MHDINVLLTCVGGLVSPGQIKDLRAVSEREINIIGVDANPGSIGFYMVDRHYVVPMGDSPGYIDAILDIAEREEVDVIIPTSPEEFLSLAQNRGLFDHIGTVIATSGYEILKKADDKGSMCTFLEETGLPHPKFYLPQNITEFEKFVHDLGYPEKPVVMKPRNARGNRGFRIIREDINRREALFDQKPGDVSVSLDEVVDMLGDGDSQKTILMEYLPGEEYSVDVLTRGGEPLVMVPKVRVVPAAGHSMVALVKRNQEVERVVADMCRAFGFDYNINIQLKYSEEGEPLPYEINPRIAASIVSCTAAGADLLYYGVKLALGEEIPKPRIIDGVKMMRYFNELFEGGY